MKKLLLATIITLVPFSGFCRQVMWEGNGFDAQELLASLHRGGYHVYSATCSDPRAAMGYQHWIIVYENTR
jgi:hypothetical protein